MMNFTPKNLFSAKRLAVAAAFAVVGLSASAQSVRILESTLTTEGGDVFQPTIQAISSNHRYVSGPAYNMETGGYGMFVYDLETDQFAYEPEVDYYGADIRAVSDNGVAIGYNGPALTFSIDGTVTYLPLPDGEDGIARDASDDLSVIVGCHYPMESYFTTACIWKDGVMQDLPLPSDEEVGFETNGSSAYYVSADGSVIVGYVVDNFSTNPLVVWRLQDDGSYVCDPVCANYFSPDGDLEGRPYILFSPTDVSRNGRYVSLNVGVYDSPEYVARYDLVTGTLEEFLPDGTSDIPVGNITESTSIADNGTIIGWMLTGEWVFQQRSACIWRMGESQPKLLANVYPEIPEIAEYDAVGFNTLCDMTPDGRYVAGFAYDSGYNYISFVIDLGEVATGVNSVKDNAGGDAEVARYTLGGVRVNAPVKGVNIVKKADGTTVKVVE